MNIFKKPFKMTCEEAQLLMVPMWAKDSSVTEQEKNAFEAHITMCPACKSEYEETCQLIPIVKEHWGPISEDTLELIGKAGQSYKPKMTVEERVAGYEIGEGHSAEVIRDAVINSGCSKGLAASN